MSDTARIDELNIIRSIPYEQFFGEMDLTENRKRDCIRLAEKYEDDFLIFLVWMEDGIDKGITNYFGIRNRLADKWKKTTSEFLYDEDFILDYIVFFADNAVKSTLNNADDPWYFSGDRAKLNAENETLTVFNRIDFLDAVASGYKKKKWITKLDGRERKSHRIADGQEVGIYETFHIGAAHLFHPRDVSDLGDGKMHPNEIINCRCQISYR